MPMLVHVCVCICGVCSLVCSVCVVDAVINTWKEGMVCSFLVSPLSGLRMFHLLQQMEMIIVKGLDFNVVVMSWGKVWGGGTM